MKVVKVYGALRKKLGQCRFEFEVDTPAQAIKALCVNFPGLDKWLIDSEQTGMGFRVAVGKERITPEDASLAVLPWSERDVFSIAPVLAGAGGGFGRIFAGIGLVTLAILTAGAAAPVLGIAGAGGGIFGASFTLGITAANAIAGIGVTLILGGVAQLLSPQPQISSLQRGKEAARLESFSFSGIVNTSKQGLPVPLVYGRAFVGSAVLSSGLDVAQLKSGDTSSGPITFEQVFLGFLGSKGQ
jgi:predicted phage tail protein